MVVVKFRSESEMKDTLRKLKKMQKFTDELVECFEDGMEEEKYREEDDDLDDEENTRKYRRTRYRRSM